jgi:hypothetical protein
MGIGVGKEKSYGAIHMINKIIVIIEVSREIINALKTTCLIGKMMKRERNIVVLNQNNQNNRQMVISIMRILIRINIVS